MVQSTALNYEDMSNHEKFNVVYDGPALANHQMDVRDLAPALIGISDLFNSANKELNGDAATVRVEVKASFKAGSFGIELLFSQDFLAQIRDMFAGQTATAIANAGAILTLVGLVGGGGLIGFLKKLKGRRPIEVIDFYGYSQVKISDTESLRVEAQVMKLWRARQVRASLEKTLSPLMRDGITEFGIVVGGNITLEIDLDEVSDFLLNPPANSEIVSDATSRKVLLLESIAFKDDNKWRVHDGQYPFHATVEDEEFIAKINQGEKFAKGDVLIVELRQVQVIEAGNLKTHYSIVHVYEHRTNLQGDLLIDSSKPPRPSRF